MLQKFATIYKPRKSAMQSGTAKAKKWFLKLPCDTSKFTYNFMGWAGSSDTNQQLKLSFSTKEEAVKYAETNGWKFIIEEPIVKKVKAKSYAENFTN